MTAGGWRNWTGDQSCDPASIEQPRNPDEVAAALARARQRSWKVRTVGSGHSFTEAALTDGMMISLEHLNRVLDVDRSSGLVRVEAGIRLRELNHVLAANGLAFENLGDIDAQTIAGATATGTHGTGAGFRNLSSTIRSIEFVRADGSRVEVNEDSDPDAWRAGRVSIGAIGIATAFTLQTVPQFTLRGVDAPQSLEEVLDRVEELADGNDHFEFYNFPNSPLALTRTNNRIEGAPRPRSRLRMWAKDEFLENKLLGLVCRVGRRLPRTIPTLNRIAARLAGRHVLVDRSDRVFATVRRVRFTEMEYALPRDRAARAVRAIRALISERGFRVSFPMEVRFGAPDDAFLSPAFGRPTSYVAVHTFEGMAWRDFFRATEEIMLDLGGRPHWGKRHFLTSDRLRGLYPEWDRFAAVRARFDPEGLFANEYIDRVLGPSGAP